MSQDSSGGFGQLSLFLTLSFVLPAVVYIGFIFMFFPTRLIALIVRASSWAPTSSLLAGLAGLGIIIFAGLLMTSITFTLEFLLFRKLSGGLGTRLLPKLDFISMVILQQKRKPITYLLQLTGQAIMHFNIWCGVLLLTLIYVGASYVSLAVFSPPKLSIAIIVILANLYTGYKFFKWAHEAVKESRRLSRRKGPG